LTRYVDPEIRPGDFADRAAFTDATGKEVFTMKSRQFKDDYLG
jgi:hypothetical protein